MEFKFSETVRNHELQQILDDKPVKFSWNRTPDHNRPAHIVLYNSIVLPSTSKLPQGTIGCQSEITVPTGIGRTFGLNGSLRRTVKQFQTSLLCAIRALTLGKNLVTAVFLHAYCRPNR